MFLSSLFTSWGQQLLLSLCYPALIKWSYWSLLPPTIFIGECRWSHILLIKVFSTLLMAQCRVLPLMFFTVLMVLLQKSPLFSSLEATRSAYFKRITLLFLYGRLVSCGRLSDFLCLAHSWESARFSVKFSHYATPWVFSRSSARRCLGYYIYAACQIIVWWIGCCWPTSLSWRLQPLYFSWFSWWV